MYLTQFEGVSETLVYKQGRLTNQNPPINVPKKCNQLTFRVNGTRTKDDYFIAKDSPDYVRIKGFDYTTKEYANFLTSLGFLVLPRSTILGTLPDPAIMKRFTLIGWTDGEHFIPYEAYKGNLTCTGVTFTVKDDGTLTAALATETTVFETSKYHIYSNAAVGSEILFSEKEGDILVSTAPDLSPVQVPNHCPICRKKLEVRGDVRLCTNTECTRVRNDFIQKLEELGVYTRNSELTVEDLQSKNKLQDIITAVCSQTRNNNRLLNNQEILKLLEIPELDRVLETFPPEFPLAVLITNQRQLPQATKDWIKKNIVLFKTALDAFEAPRRKKVWYRGQGTKVTVKEAEKWYQFVEPEEAEALYVSDKFFLEV